MTIISWNVNGLRAIVKKEFYENINRINPDILCFQETKAQEKIIDKLKTTGFFCGYIKQFICIN